MICAQCLVLCLFLNYFGFAHSYEEVDARIVQGSNTNLEEAVSFLKEYNAEASAMCFRVSYAQWTYATNMTDHNKRKMIEEQTLKAAFDKISWRKAAMFDFTRIKDAAVRRQLKFLMTHSRASLNDEKYNEIYHLIAEMKDIYAHVKICPFNNINDGLFCDLNLEPDVTRIMANSRNPLELMHIWREWHDKTGPPMKNKFMRYVQIANQAARMHGFLDAGEEMRYTYEDIDLENELAESYQKLQPLYKELFTYVRRKLSLRYGPSIVRVGGPIPAHLLGNMWTQEWSKIMDIVIPFPQYGMIDVTNEMLRQGFTPLRMFQLSEEFYTSLGLKAMPPEFWKYSMLEKPNDRKVQCTTSAWDFCNKVDFRIKQCTEVTMNDLISLHHEMAHIEYYLHYANLPYPFRDGANSGFHEGLSNAISLSVFNLAHLHRIGLFNNSTDIFELNINFLLWMALKKVAYAPYAYIVDLWRYEIFQNGVQNMNSIWWALRLRYQGIVPPSPRTERHLDPAAKRHIPADIPYMKYYVALLLEFQIHQALCLAAGYSGPLHTCDIYRSREAGRMLMQLMRVGKSKPWKEVIKTLTKGQTDQLSADAMINYFQPLYNWLKVQNSNETIIGWTSSINDVGLFQPLVSASISSKRCEIYLTLALPIFYYFQITI